MANNIIATGTVNALGFESEAPHNFAFATWRAIPFSPDGPAVFLDGTKVPIYDGQLDANGDFDGALIGDTNQMRPPGVSYMFTINPVASVPPITISNVLARAGWIDSLGTILTARIAPLRIQAAALVYAYSDKQVINPTAGSGYVNTTTSAQWVFVGSGSVGMWIEVVGAEAGGGSPGGPNTAVQFNAGGIFGGDANLVYSSGAPSTLTLVGQLISKVTSSTNGANHYFETPDTTIQVGLNGKDVPSGGGLWFVYNQTTAVLLLSLNVTTSEAVFAAKVTAGSFATTGNVAAATVNTTGAASVGGTLHAVGAATLDSTLKVAGQTTVGNPAGAGLVIAPSGGYQGAPTIATANGGPVDLGNFGDGFVMQDSSGDVLQVIAAGHLAIQMFAAGGQEWGEINNTNSAFNVASGAAATNGIHLVYAAGGVSIAANGQAPIKTYLPPTINDVTGLRAFSTAYQNTSGMTLCVSMTGLSHGSATGFLASLIGPANPPANRVSRNENTASVEGAECAMTVMVPPGWWYEILSGGDIYGIGGWWEYTCP